MTKCDICKYSKNKDGKIICPYVQCVLTTGQHLLLLEILKNLN